MSYSVDCNCPGCVLNKECTDYELIRGAVNTIHDIGYAKSHRGCGSVIINCSNYIPKDVDTQ